MVTYLLKGSNEQRLLHINTRHGRPLEMSDEEMLDPLIETLAFESASYDVACKLLEDIGFEIEDEDAEARIIEWKGDL